MSFTVTTTPRFAKELRRLAKKFRSLLDEFAALEAAFADAPVTGTPIGHDCYKIRLAIKSKGKGKSGGARVITHVHVTETTVYLLSIYDKSEQENLPEAELLHILKSLTDDQ